MLFSGTFLEQLPRSPNMRSFASTAAAFSQLSTALPKLSSVVTASAPTGCQSGVQPIFLCTAFKASMPSSA